jgi:hypothetical protein
LFVVVSEAKTVKKANDFTNCKSCHSPASALPSVPIAAL